MPKTAYFETHARLHFLAQYRGDALIEVRHNAHGKLRFNKPITDQVVKRICESHSDAVRLKSVSLRCVPSKATGVRCGSVELIIILLCLRHLRCCVAKTCSPVASAVSGEIWRAFEGLTGKACES